MFEVAVVLFIFKREDTVLEILKVLNEIKPSRLYIIGDGPRDKCEEIVINKVRANIEKNIIWNCEVIKKYADKNIGVYENIALGAKWVFEKEECAIFLEDDNLPSISFFEYCKYCLETFKKNEKVFWVCGTNYRGHTTIDNEAYFTQHLLPCGWASWAYKFNKYYDFNLKKFSKNNQKKLKSSYLNKKLYKQQVRSVRYELFNKNNYHKYASWDYHLITTLRCNGLYGICPSVNLIKNIGVDEHSIHGGTSYENVMTKRFCGVEKYELNFPLVISDYIEVNNENERELDKIILHPLKNRLKDNLGKLIKTALGKSEFERLKNENK